MKPYDIEAYFWKEKGAVKRNKTKIIFDRNENKCIGIVLMLNPGKCEPKNPDDIGANPKKFSTFNGNLKRDPTQGKIAHVIKPAYDDKPSGYVFITNLCEKKGTDPKKLLMYDFGENPGTRV